MPSFLSKKRLTQGMAVGFILSQPLAVYADAYPVLTDEEFQSTRTLSFGQQGIAVKTLQTKLNHLGYYNEEINGKFDPYTEVALKEYQRENNLEVTGQADKRITKHLVQTERDYYMKPLQDISDPIQLGEKGKEVELLQRALHFLDYYNGDVDGIFGPSTERAVKSFQAQENLPVTANVEQEMLEKMVNASKKPVRQTTYRRSTTTKDPKIVQVSAKSSNSSTVQIAQQYLGTPYIWGGESPGGFDCSGYIQYVFLQKGIKVPRTVPDLWNVSLSVSEPSVGDFVFYETYKPGPSHMGIYIGNNKFIHASLSRGVTISDMTENYWTSRYLGSRRLVID
ncbi:peptidoglycan-binding protein [Bacillaceae bacterium S4-13-56]